MKLSEYPEPIREAWATWEAYRRLGFSADDIYWEFNAVVDAGPGIALNVVLRAQDKVMVVTCSTSMSKEDAERLRDFAKTFHEEITLFTEEEMTTAYRASFIWKNKHSFLIRLKQKGFMIPKSMN